MMANISDRILQRLTATGQTERGASIAAGLGPTSLRNIIERSSNPRTDTLEKIAKQLKTTTEWLMKGEGSEIHTSKGVSIPFFGSSEAGAFKHSSLSVSNQLA